MWRKDLDFISHCQRNTRVGGHCQCNTRVGGHCQRNTRVGGALLYLLETVDCSSLFEGQRKWNRKRQEQNRSVSVMSRAVILCSLLRKWSTESLCFSGTCMLHTLSCHCSGLSLGWQGGRVLSPILLKIYSAPKKWRMAVGPIKTVSHEHQGISGICTSSVFCQRSN